MSQGDDDRRNGDAGPKEEDDVLASIRRAVSRQDDASDAPGQASARRPGGDPAGGAEPASAPSAARRDGVLPLGRAMRVEAGEREPADDDDDDDAPLMLSPTMRADGGPFPRSQPAAPGETANPPEAPPPAPSAPDSPPPSTTLRDDAPGATADMGADADDAPSLRLDGGRSGDDASPAGAETPSSGPGDPDAAGDPRSTDDARTPGDEGAARTTPPTSDLRAPASPPAPPVAPTRSTPSAPASRSTPSGPASQPAPSGRDLRRALATGTDARAGGLPRDGDALEALIRRILREELSGEMGERVSRNIKMLVEREVRRAMEQFAAETDREG